MGTWVNWRYHPLEPAPTPLDDRRDDDDDPELTRFLTDCRRFMAERPSLWIEEPGPPASADAVTPTTDEWVAQAHANREGQVYPTAAQAIANLPTVLWALCDPLLDVHPNAMDVARRLASIIDAIDNVRGGPAGNAEPLH